jgi:hypothetical protein
MESPWQFLKRLEKESPHNPVIALLGIYPKECRSIYCRDTYTAMFTELCTIAKIWNQSKGPTSDEWINKM